MFQKKSVCGDFYHEPNPSLILTDKFWNIAFAFHFLASLRSYSTTTFADIMIPCKNDQLKRGLKIHFLEIELTLNITGWINVHKIDICRNIVQISGSTYVPSYPSKICMQNWISYGNSGSKAERSNSTEFWLIVMNHKHLKYLHSNFLENYSRCFLCVYNPSLDKYTLCPRVWPRSEAS